MKSLFLEETTNGSTLVALGVVSLILLAVDHFTSVTDGVRSALSIAVMPVVVVANLPSRGFNEVADVLQTRAQMRERIRALEDEQRLLRAKTAKMAAMSAENNRLRDLLGSAAKLGDNVLVAELLAIDPDPDRHEIVIDKGSQDRVFVGQPVIDAEGLMGQVVATGPLTSRVLLLSDVSHSVPVQVVRSNLRLIAHGTGATGALEVLYVQATADVKVGDLLVTSGLGGRFPTGYPVAVISSLEHEPGAAFATVHAQPTARLDRTRHVLLVFREDHAEANDDG